MNLKEFKSKLSRLIYVGPRGFLLAVYNRKIQFYQEQINKGAHFEKEIINLKNKKTNLICKIFEQKFGKIREHCDNLEIRNSKPIIFVFWYQGITEMPKIIQMTYKSIIKNRGDYEVVLLNKNNIQEYTKIPDFFLDNLDKGLITLTIFSDYLRMRLLCEYNCVWLDSSILLVKELPLNYLKYNFLSVKSDNIYDNKPEYLYLPSFKFGQAYFLSGKNKKVFNAVRNMFELYFKNCKFNLDYFMVYYFFEYLYRNFKQFHDDVNNIPFNNTNVENLLYYRTNEKMCFNLTDTDVMFKLTYKCNLEQDLENKNSILYYYLKEYI